MSGRQYNFQDILNGLGDVGNDSLAPETGANSDPSQNILLNAFAQVGEGMTTADSASATVTNPYNVNGVLQTTYDNATWSTFQWR